MLQELQFVCSLSCKQICRRFRNEAERPDEETSQRVRGYFFVPFRCQSSSVKAKYFESQLQPSGIVALDLTLPVFYFSVPLDLGLLLSGLDSKMFRSPRINVLFEAGRARSFSSIQQSCARSW
jgi:hypothetical protein